MLIIFVESAQILSQIAMAVSDEELAQLLQLGFDLETSKWALLNTNSVEEAIER